MQIGKYRLFNLDRQQSACFGGLPSDQDRSIVYEEGKEWPVKSGTLRECHDWIKQQEPN